MGTLQPIMLCYLLRLAKDLLHMVCDILMMLSFHIHQHLLSIIWTQRQELLEDQADLRTAWETVKHSPR